MISLLTGTPGAGKTAWLVHWLMSEGTQASRPIYVHGIPKLKIPHTPIVCTALLCECCAKLKREQPETAFPIAENWHEWAPDGALILLDEVQNVWRPRAPTAKLPDSVALLETHRHKGIDFWMVSQGPHLFDCNVRRLIGRHIHLKATSLGRYQYEWAECKDNVQSDADAVRRSYRLPKAAFDQYQSASLHTKQSHRLPLSVYVLALALLITLPLGLNTFFRIKAKIAGEKAAPATPVSPISATTPSPTAKPRATFEPMIPGRPETAQAYAHLLKVHDYPFPSACIAVESEKRCNCSTNQGTPYPMLYEICLEYAHGRVFNPYKPKRGRPQAIETTAMPLPTETAVKSAPLKNHEDAENPNEAG